MPAAGGKYINPGGIARIPSHDFPLTAGTASPGGGGRGATGLAGTKPGKSSSPVVRLVISCVEVSSSAVIQCMDVLGADRVSCMMFPAMPMDMKYCPTSLYRLSPGSERTVFRWSTLSETKVLDLRPSGHSVIR